MDEEELESIEEMLDAILRHVPWWLGGRDDEDDGRPTSPSFAARYGRIWKATAPALVGAVVAQARTT